MKFSKPGTGGSCNVAATGKRQLDTAHASTLLLLPLVFMLLATTSTCLGLPLESTTTATDIDEVTAGISPQQPVQQPAIVTAATVASVPNAVNISETATTTTATTTTTTTTRPTAKPIESDVSSDIEAEIADNSFVPLGENLEENIRNAVKSEVESQIQALLTYPEPLHQQEKEENAETSTVLHEKPIENKENAIQNVREPKTLDAETAAKLDAQATQAQETEEQTQLDNDNPTQTVNSEVNEADVKAAEAVTDNIAMESEESEVSVSMLLENHDNTEEPIDLMALERELHIIKMKESTPVPPTFELTIHQVTKKQGVENFLPMAEHSKNIDKPTDKVVENRNELQHELEAAEAKQEAAVNFNEIEQNLIQSEEKQTKPEAEPVSVLEAQPASELELEQSQLSSESAQKSVLKLDTESVAESAQQSDSNIEPESVTVSKTESLSEAESKSEPKLEPAATVSLPIEKLNESHEKSSFEDKTENTEQAVNENTEIEAPEITEQTDQITPIVDTSTKKQSVNVATVKTEADIEEVPKIETELGETTSNPVLNEASSTVRADVLVENQSSEEVELDNDGSGESVAKGVEQVNNDSSEEDDKPDVVEQTLPKRRSDDSTATPLVSYPPHNAGQTFNDNLADERTAHLSLESNNRSALIIVLCSGTAVLFIVISLIIFVVSFQRQHGTLDIEMQEQRLGKDDLDEENVQMNLLDVDLSSPAANPTQGNEETDECL